ncbi:MAG TPA: Vms1/Ankzf1 family peptidyl-tRNA hydrolase [Gemmatimonadota bacterium]|jgi:rubrerythrin
MTELEQAIDRLAHLPPSPHPVVSCFVNTGPDGRGRPTFMTFLKKAFAERLRSFPERADAVRHLEADRDRIFGFLSGELDSAAQSVAIHASDADDLWEAHAFHTPFDGERLVVGPVPHLYPLVKLADQSPLYAVCVADSHQARLVVCGLGAVLTEEDFEGPEPIDRTRVAGWAEVRYQARIEDHIQKNAREVVERLGKIVEKGEVDYVILGGDELTLGELRRHLTPAIREKVIDEEHISIDAGAHEILKRTLRVVRDTEARASRRLADTVIDRFRAGGLAVAGLAPTIEALNLEQVDQLLLSESFNGDREGWQCAQCRVLGLEPAPDTCPFCEAPLPERIDLREAMVRRAERTGRKVEIVESHAGLEALDGVGATLRYRV